MQTTPITPDALIVDLRVLLAAAAEGDRAAAVQAHSTFAALDEYLSGGGTPPASWEAHADVVWADGRVVADMQVAEDGSLHVVVPSLVSAHPAPAAPVAAPVVEPVAEEDGQFGFCFDEPAPAPEPVVDPEPVMGSRTLVFPRPKSVPRTPRRDAAARAGLPVDVPSTLGHGTFQAGFNNPTESHVVQAKAALKAGRKNHQVFWLIYDTEGGLTDSEMEIILSMSHQSLSATRNTLMNKGYIRDSGERRKTQYGNDAAVWVPTEWARQRVGAGLETRLPASA